MNREHIAAAAMLDVFFCLLFVVFYGGASVLAPWVPWRIHVDFPFEAAIPFKPDAAYVYLSIVPALAIAPLILRDMRRLLPLFCVLSVETLVGFVMFILLPVEPSLADRALPAPDSAAFAVADWLNMDGNWLPSLHVAFAITAAFAYSERASISGKALLGMWAVAVAASTLLIHQHYVADVIAGAVLAWASWRWIAPWARRTDVADAVDVELLCLINYARFSLRHIRYLFISCTLVLRSLPAFRQRRLLRTGFAFLQSIDDLLDGDRRSTREPLEIANELIASLQAKEFGDDGLSRLGRAFRTDLVARGGVAALDDAIELIRTMMQDRIRVQRGLLLDAEALEAHHRATFKNSLNLLLLAADAELRAADVPELVDALGWCSTVRDLAQDLDHGLINIPRHIVEAARKDASHRGTTALAESPLVLDWLATGAAHVLPKLDRVDARLAQSRDKRGGPVLALFSRSVRRYTKSVSAMNRHQ